ncbi:MAG: tetratricopeptide repeat protein [Leptospiraceae bacterium]|nr:tetratricopeptide repeat protein [Leptospiraceae bacterium]MDW8307627.1 hypothetical protein [Leptospiraceae bacterium]
MIRDIFGEIWKNPLARSILLGFSGLIVFASIFRYRNAIYNFYDRILTGESFDSPYRQKRKPYSFEEDGAAAKRLVESGLFELAEYAKELYNRNETVKVGSLQLDSGNLLGFLDESSQLSIQDLLHDLSLFCEPFVSVEESWHKLQRERRLSRRKLREAEDPSQKNPFAYAISERDYEKVVKNILRIDRLYFDLALKKKPDVTALIYFREKLYEALCRGSEIPKFWQKAMEYREYLAEKKAYREMGEPEKNREFLPEKTYIYLSQDSVYALYLKEFFQKMRKVSSAIEMQLDKANFFYTFSRDASYLGPYIELLLEKARQGGRREAEESFATLYALQGHGLERNPQYLLALAETAFRKGDLQKARALANQVLKTIPDLKREEERQAFRLDFILKMNGA